MTQSRKDIILSATRKAISTRTDQKLGITDPVASIYDLAQKLGVDVRFWDTPTAEGMYLKEPPTIILSSLRPPGRQAFTCAHELGHHVFEHGVRVDELDWLLSDPNEFLADCFAAALLMPKTVVNHSFTIRGWSIRDANPIQIYTIATWLGVGYTTLITHGSTTLNMLSLGQAAKLEKVTPKQIRSKILGYSTSDNLIVVDSYWYGRPIDVYVGDLIFISMNIEVEKHGANHCVQLLNEDQNGMLVKGMRPGIARIFNPISNWAAYVRVTPKRYVGRSIYRHLEEEE